jgi:L-arabinokinase
VSPDLLKLDPVPTLLRRVRSELSADFGAAKPIRVSRAPGRLDVMGGIADYTGSLVCEYPLDRAAAVALSPREDRDLQVFSFNLLDEHKPFTVRVPLDALASHPPDVLRREFDQPGRKWAAYVAGCLVALHVHRRVLDGSVRGMNVALYSTVPPGAGVSSSAAIEVATMMNLYDHLPVHSMRAGEDVAALCQWAENHIVGAPCGIMDPMTSCLGEAGRLLRMVCQPWSLLPALELPAGVRVLGIDSAVRHSVAGGAYGRTRCAAFMGHAIILARMRDLGEAAGRPLQVDPLRGYLANLDPDDYKNLFRPHLPDSIRGREFLDRYGATTDPVTRVEADVDYAVVHATDHHVLEARRVRRFCEFLEQAAGQNPGPKRKGLLDRAGHLMYASHLSYTNDAMLGAPECDLLVRLVREREAAGLYGARITGGGSGGTVAVLADEGERADAAVAEILDEYEVRTGRAPELFTGTSPGAWAVGTAVVGGG